MAGIIDLFQAHGVLTVFFGVLVEQLGAPIPAMPFLLLAGAQSATEGMFALYALGAAALACVIADSLWFMAGRRHGRSVLGLLCRISISPGTCVHKSESSFARRGALTVLFAKFIPGVSALTSPMAGAMGMPLLTFVLLDLAGTLLWAGGGIVAGAVFHEEVQLLLDFIEGLGSTAVAVVLAAVALYVGWRVLRRILVHRGLRAVAGVSPHEVAQMIARREPFLLLDVRSDEPLPTARIPGAVSARLNGGLELPTAHGTDLRIVTYCDCPNDASAARAALELARRGRVAHVLLGGFHAWAAAGFDVAPTQDAQDAQDAQASVAPATAAGALAVDCAGC